MHEDSTASPSDRQGRSKARTGPLPVASAVMHWVGLRAPTTILNSRGRTAESGLTRCRGSTRSDGFPWMVQAAYFARRLAVHDLTGGGGSGRQREGPRPSPDGASHGHGHVEHHLVSPGSSAALRRCLTNGGVWRHRILATGADPSRRLTMLTHHRSRRTSGAALLSLALTLALTASASGTPEATAGAPSVRAQIAHSLELAEQHAPLPSPLVNLSSLAGDVWNVQFSLLCVLRGHQASRSARWATLLQAGSSSPWATRTSGSGLRRWTSWGSGVASR